jgi:sulfur transfer protein SufE/stress-induced morphogen
MMTEAFSSIPDEKTRHKQLLYMASKLPDVDDSVRIPENKVPGCLSTVHVDCTAEKNENDEYVVNYFGDSDGLLTKGLLALLIRGLSGCTPEQINAVDPQFVQAAKISQTLTPGRNNGFLNMLVVMKKKALDAVEREKSGGVIAAEPVGGGEEAEEIDNSTNGVVTSFDPIEGKPMYNTILSTLIGVLKPTSIKLVDNSSQHAGHAGSKGWAESGESHFALEIVADAFEGLSLVKRHKLIYMLLGDTMEKIHALEIKAKSPSEL